MFQLISNAHYVSTQKGTINVATSSSLGGSYEGVFPSGLLSTLKSADDSFEYGRIAHDDVERPMFVSCS